MKNPFRGLFRRQNDENSTQNTQNAPPEGQKGDRLTPDGLRITEFPAPVTQILRLYNVGGNYAQIYAHQPNVRTAIQTVAREAAELHLKMYYKDTRGPDLPAAHVEVDHPMLQLLYEPSPGESTYRFWFSLFADIEIYDIAYWLKTRQNGIVRALTRIPPANLLPVRDPLTYSITHFRTADGKIYLKDDLVVFYGYDPATDHGAIAPMESIRRIIAEDIAAGSDREGRWRNSARKEGVIEREIDAKEMDDAAKESFLVDMEDSLGGPGGSGRPLILEPGMRWNDFQWSPREMEYLNARKLSRLEVAAHFHIPPAMMAAAANNAEADQDTLRYFYQSSLPPRLTRVEHEIEAQLLPDFEPFSATRRNFYVEFNLDNKLRGSFEEQAGIMATTVGGPVVTVNEGRARMNLPPMEGAENDQLYAPLNSVRGGGPQASPQNPTGTPSGGIEPAGTTPGGGSRGQRSDDRDIQDIEELLYKADAIAEANGARDEIEAKTAERIAKEAVIVVRETARLEERVKNLIDHTFTRQDSALGKGKKELKMSRWNKELSDDLFGLMYQSALDTCTALTEQDWWDLSGVASATRDQANDFAGVINVETASYLEKDPTKAFEQERSIALAQEIAAWTIDWAKTQVAEQLDAKLKTAELEAELPI